MKTIGNILWLLIVGWESALGWAIIGVLLLPWGVTTPFARQCFKFAHFSLWPFGREAIASPTAFRGSSIGNVLWFVFAGLWLGLGYIVGGIVLCLTIIGFPFGMQAFKMAGLAFTPFGKEIVRTKDLRSGAWINEKYAHQMDPPPAAPPVQPTPPVHPPAPAPVEGPETF